MIKVILWDMDNTLLDFSAAERAAVKTCFALYGFGECTDEMVARYSKINLRYWEKLERGEMTRPEILAGRWREFLETCGKDSAVAEEFNLEYEHHLTDTVIFMPGAEETLRTLQGRVRQCIVTNGNLIVQIPKLERSGLNELVEKTFISEAMGAEKPSREFFAEVFAYLGDYAPEEIMIVGDSLTSDMMGGVNTGIQTCWYNYKGKSNELKIPIDHEIADLGDVVKIVFA